MLKRDLFICHSSADAAMAKELVVSFERHGITCWLASRDVPVGRAYQAEIVEAIAQCGAMLLLFTSATNESAHVLREIELAEQEHKPIFPLRIHAAEPVGGLKYMLANRQWIERRALGNRIFETIETLLRPAKQPTSPPQSEIGQSPAPTPAPVSAISLQMTIPRPAWVAGAIGAIAFVCVTAWLVISRPATETDRGAANTQVPRAATVQTPPAVSSASNDASTASSDADRTSCFSLGNDDYKAADKIDPGMVACTRMINGGKFKGNGLAALFRARASWKEKKGDYDSALADYGTSIRIEPNNVESYDYRADVYQDKGDLDAALEDYNQATKIDPTYAAAYFSRGRIYEKRNETENAIAEYNIAIEQPTPNRIAQWAQDNARARLKVLMENLYKKN
jgi:hypothetical protein